MKTQEEWMAGFKKYTLVIVLGFFLTNAFSQNALQLQTGDFIFQDMDCGDLCDAIERVTTSKYGKHYSHMGMCIYKNDSLFVLEAVGKGVCLTPYEQFINRSLDSVGKPKVNHARIKKEYQSVLSNAIANALAYMNTPYDYYYIMGEDKLYCSELFYLSFKKANNNRVFFELQPMTFKDPATQKFFPAWVKYYNDLDVPIPEGFLGCNPGGISLSDKFDFF